jgi:hypothetical protein
MPRRARRRRREKKFHSESGKIKYENLQPTSEIMMATLCDETRERRRKKDETRRRQLRLIFRFFDIFRCCCGEKKQRPEP